MSDVRRRLTQIADRARVPESAFERLLVRRDRKRRNQRIASGVTAFAVLGVLAAAFAYGQSVEPNPEPVTPPPAIRNGWIVFSAVDPEGASSDLFAVRPGGMPHRIVGQVDVDRPETCPVVSPSGDRLAYLEGTGILAVVSFDASDASIGTVQRFSISSAVGCPAWSLDGRRLAWASDEGLGHGHVLTLRVEEDGGVWQNRAIDVPVGPIDVEWSPDGSSIAFGTRTGVHVVVDHGDNVRLHLDPHEFLAREGADDQVVQVSWSPQGRAFAVSGLRRTGPTSSIRFLRVYDVVSKERTNLVLRPGCCGPTLPAWSPDGSRIAYATGGGISLSSPDGNRVTRLPAIFIPALGDVPVAPVADLQWSPDGERLLFLARSDGYGVVSVKADGSEPLLLTPAAWSDWLSIRSAGELDWQAIR